MIKNSLLLLLVTATLLFAQESMYTKHAHKMHHIKTSNTVGNPSGGTVVLDTTVFDNKAFGRRTDGSAADTLWSINTTTVDTSRAYIKPDQMDIYYDFSGTTVDLTLRMFFYVGDLYEHFGKYSVPDYGDNWAEFATTYSISSTTPGFIVLNAAAFPNAKWMYFTLTGGGTNTADVSGILKLSSYDPNIVR